MMQCAALCCILHKSAAYCIPLLRMQKLKKSEKRLTVNLTEESFRLLKELSVDQDRSLSWLVSQAIDLYLKSEGKKANAKGE